MSNSVIAFILTCDDAEEGPALLGWPGCGTHLSKMDTVGRDPLTGGGRGAGKKTEDAPGQLGVLEHSKVVNSAYFSPWTGRKVLTTCIDNRLRVWDFLAGRMGCAHSKCLTFYCNIYPLTSRSSHTPFHPASHHYRQSFPLSALRSRWSRPRMPPCTRRTEDLSSVRLCQKSATGQRACRPVRACSFA